MFFLKLSELSPDFYDLLVICNTYTKTNTLCASDTPVADSATKPIYSENPPFRTINLKFGDKDVVARVVYEGENAFRVTVGEREYRATGSAVFHPEANFTELTCDIEGAVSKQRVLVAGPSVRLFTADGSITFEQRLPKFLSQQGRRRRRRNSVSSKQDDHCGHLAHAHLPRSTIR